jgi:2,3-bisphosphoglycerate-dependent phosphoglycerate mutase/probable phosphoglycerate mutase
VSLTHLILLRHGETDWNAELRMQGYRDIPLNATGRAQALAAAPSVAALAPDLIVSSDLQRAVFTAEAVGAVTGLPVSTDARLRETSMGEWEGLTRADIINGWPGSWERWRETSAVSAPPGGESRIEVAARAAEVVAELDATTASRALLVAHGGLVVGLTGSLLDLPHPAWGALIGIGNCHWVVLHRATSGWRLHTYNGGLGGIVMPGGEDQVAGT